MIHIIERHISSVTWLHILLTRFLGYFFPRQNITAGRLLFKTRRGADFKKKPDCRLLVTFYGKIYPSPECGSENPMNEMEG